MKLNRSTKEPLLIIGEGRLCCSVTACLVKAGYAVTLVTGDIEWTAKNIKIHFVDIAVNGGEAFSLDLVEIRDSVDTTVPFKISILVTDEAILKKRLLIQ